MTEIIEFLVAQFAEEERRAKLAVPFKVTYDYVIEHAGLGHSIAEFAIAYSPARVLHEVAAKRELFEIWQRMDNSSDNPSIASFAEEILNQLLASYGKRAVFQTGDWGSSWQLEDLTEEG